jgi:CheY-like chemotaxis protein
VVDTRPKVLVVDDEESLREVMAETLADEGYAVETAENGARALEVLAQRRPDAIILDLMMPVLDGWAFVEGYRDVAGADIPIVSVSAVLNSDVAQRLQRLGVRMCLTKPFEIDELIGCVRQIVGPERSTQDAGAEAAELPRA